MSWPSYRRRRRPEFVRGTRRQGRRCHSSPTQQWRRRSHSSLGKGFPAGQFGALERWQSARRELLASAFASVDVDIVGPCAWQKAWPGAYFERSRGPCATYQFCQGERLQKMPSPDGDGLIKNTAQSQVLALGCYPVPIPIVLFSHWTCIAFRLTPLRL